MRPIEEAITLLRGYGIRLWFFVQSINQIEAAYPGPRAKTLTGNFSIQQYFGISDPETASHVSRMTGKRTEISPNFSTGWNRGSSSGGQSGSSSHGSSGGKSIGAVERDHIKPEEVLREDASESVFIFRQGRFPAKAQRLTYFNDPDFQPDAEVKPPQKASLVSCVLCILGLFGAASLYQSAPAHSPATFHGTSTRQPAETLLPAPRGTRSGTVPVRALPPATIAIRCPACGNEDDIPAAYAGRAVICRECNALLAIPSTSEETP